MEHSMQISEKFGELHPRARFSTWLLMTRGPIFEKNLWRIYDHKFVVTKLWRTYDEVVTILWSTYDFSKIGPKIFTERFFSNV